jgi:type IV pilus secretin PilQ/predicted competence protein
MKRDANFLRTFGLWSGRVILAAGLSNAMVLGSPGKPSASALGPRSTGMAAGEPSSSQPSGLVQISSVAIQTADHGQETLINVQTDRLPPYHFFELSHPRRLVVDLDGARNVSNRWKYAAEAPFVTQVRLGRFSEKAGGTVRVVADLAGNPAYDVRADNSGIEIALKSRKRAGQTPHNSTEMAATEASRPSESPKQADPPEVASIQPVAVTVSSAPTSETKAQDPPSPVASTSPAAADPTPTAALPEAAEAKAAANIMAGTTLASLTPMPGQADGGPAAGPKYTGQPISVDLKNVDIKDFFRLIHTISGLNVIVDPDVSGTVTMVLDDVPWDQALAIVLRDNGLGEQLQGNVLRIAKQSTLEAEQAEVQKMAQAKMEAAPLVTVFRRVSYAKASIIATLLKSWVGGGALSSRGSVLVDDRTNTLIISDIPQRISMIENVINKLDTKAAQVSIEARIVRVTSDFARNLQSALSTALTNTSGSTIAGGATGQSVGATTVRPPAVTTGTAGGFGVFVISNAGARYVINAALAAAETRDEAKTISRPSIVTQNNVQGTVIQGTQIPIQTTINNTISVQYVQASLQLQVTPQVTADGNVFLTIQVTNATPGPALTAAGPSIATQSATTEVLVPNGGTVVFGGVNVTGNSKAVTQVPWLGAIPILGHLFKNSSTTSNDQELLFFVTPRVLPG